MFRDTMAVVSWDSHFVAAAALIDGTVRRTRLPWLLLSTRQKVTPWFVVGSAHRPKSRRSTWSLVDVVVEVWR